MTRQDWDPRRPEGGSALAGVLLLLVGVWQVVVGYAVAVGGVFAFTGGGYWYGGEDAAWGWVNLGIGLGALVVGLGQAGVARRLTRWAAHPIPALLAAVVSAMNQFLLAPQYPLWASLALVANVFVIWGLAIRARFGGDRESDHFAP